MNRSHQNLFTVLWIVLFLDYDVHSEILFESGWYKSHQKGPRHTLNNVSFIDSSIVSDTKYLRIRAEMPTIFRGGFRKLERVETLKLAACDILDIEPASFEHLKKLAILSLHDNQIEHIKSGVFNKLLLTKLYLHRNQIQVIETQAFDDMPNLLLLKLNSNSISSWDSNWFQNTPRLTEIFFRRNELRFIPSEAFKNVKGEKKRNGIQSDTKIYLSKNYISSIDSNAFSGIRELSQLWLDRNELEELDEKLFSNMDNMEVISLSKNRLRIFPKNILSSLKTDLLILDLAHNNNVTCLDYNIVSKVKLTRIEKIKKLDCECVKKLVDRFVKSGNDNEISSDCGIENKSRLKPSSDY